MFSQSITSCNAPKALGPYSPAIKLGDFVYCSGQLPLDVVSGELVVGGIKEQTQQVLKNLEAILMEMGLNMQHVVKTTVFMTDLNEFDDMNEVYGQFFAQPYPARSTVQVAVLPKKAKIEIECLVIDTLAYEQQMQQGCGGCANHSEQCEGSCGSDEGCGCDCSQK